MNNKKSEKEWEKILSPDQYQVLRRKGTERPYTGEYNNHFEKGNYKCSACGKELFKSENKFKSNCGWPSFESAIKDSVKINLMCHMVCHIGYNYGLRFKYY